VRDFTKQNSCTHKTAYTHTKSKKKIQTSTLKIMPMSPLTGGRRVPRGFNPYNGTNDMFRYNSVLRLLVGHHVCIVRYLFILWCAYYFAQQSLLYCTNVTVGEYEISYILLCERRFFETSSTNQTKNREFSYIRPNFSARILVVHIFLKKLWKRKLIHTSSPKTKKLWA
jgi:hypothetical protein